MARQQADVRREGILLATIAEIEARGMAAFRMTDIAAQAGVSSGLLYYHFATKDALVVAALEWAVTRDADRLDRALARKGDAVSRLREVLRTYGPTGQAHGWTLWIEAWATALRVPSVRRSLRKLDDRWRDAVVSVIGQGVDEGVFVCPDPPGTVARVSAMLDGLSVASIIYRSVSRQQLRVWVRVAMADELGIIPDALA